MQEKKEQAIDEFLEEHTDDKISNQKKIEKKFKAKVKEFEQKLKSSGEETLDG